MGHLGHLKEEYQQLLTRLDASPVGMPEPTSPRAREGFKEILEIMYTPEQAEIASRMPVKPASLEKVAEQVGLPLEVLRPKLDRMCDKGLVMDLVNPTSGKVRYFLSPPVIGFFEFALMRTHDMYPKKRIAEAMDAYVHGDRAFADHVFGGDTVLGRTLTQEEHLAEEVRPDVLDWQLTTAVVRDARSIAVSICYCRHKAEHLHEECDAPKEICLSLNAGADFVTRRKFGRAIDAGEALELLHQAKDANLVQIADNVQKRPAYICNCCGCCCGQLRAINDYALPAVNPSGFVPQTDDALCKGCSRCSRVCPVTAITMAARRVGGRRKNDLRPLVDHDRCIGCGVCASTCRPKAMSMVEHDQRPHVPENVIERITRMSLERGRLPHLMFDMSQSRGHRFMNQVVQAVVSLPAAERALANDQIRSRFVRWAMKSIRDPTG